MTTMTEREVQKRLVDLSVVTLSALVLGGGYLLAAIVDSERARLAPPVQEETVQLATVRLDTADVAPVPGLQPAPQPTRRVVVVRRTRAS